eukprot:1631481-Alexandrium_andersonii.AAC.1
MRPGLGSRANVGLSARSARLAPRPSGWRQRARRSRGRTPWGGIADEDGAHSLRDALSPGGLRTTAARRWR